MYMKKVLLVLGMITVLLMTGCNKDTTTQTNEVQNSQNNQQQDSTIVERIAYSNEQLIEMVKKYREAKGEYIPEYIEIDGEKDDIVNIHLYDINSDVVATSDWYYINRDTGKGKDVLDKDIDLTFILNDYYWFVTDSYHCDTPGAFAGAMPDMYYFSSDNTYSWIISDYTMNERVIAKKGTWKIENNKLILHEQEETYLDGGKIIEVKNDPMLGDDTVLVDYTVTNRNVDNISEHSIEYVGISDFSKEIDVDNIRYEYKLDGKVMFAGIPNSLERSVNDWLEISNLKK